MPAERPEAPPTGNGVAPTAPEGDRGQDLEGLITESEALRLMAQDLQVRLKRLVASLKQMRGQARAMQSAMASLRQLQQLAP
jgi:hypothetical protein